jgi:hypothetical protein
VGTCAATTYDGNVYDPNNQITGQWGLAQGGTDPGDKLNPLECVHLSEDPDGNPATTNSQIIPGTWTLRVKYGAGGSVFTSSRASMARRRRQRQQPAGRQ